MQLSSVQHAVGHPEANPWIQKLGKIGYAIKGVVYAIMGLLALQVGLGEGGKVAGEHEAVEHVGRQPFGEVLLVAIGVGLLCYALWRFIEGLMDPHREGRTLRGVGGRITAIGSSVVNGAVGVAAIQLALGKASADHHPRGIVATLMHEPWGLAVIGIGGLIVTGVGLFHVYAGFTDRFTEHLELSRSSRVQRAWAIWSGRIGFVARGIVFSVVGVALIQAAITTNPREAKDMKDALQHLASQPFGPALLIAVASGLLAYGIHLITTVPYRRLIG